MKKIVKFTWAEFDEAVDSLARRIHKEAYDQIYGVPRGGLVLAVALSHRLDIPLALSVPIELKKRQRTLIVDEISDTGQTLRYLCGKDAICAVIHLKELATWVPCTWVQMVEKNVWIEYPWEKQS